MHSWWHQAPQGVALLRPGLSGRTTFYSAALSRDGADWPGQDATLDWSIRVNSDPESPYYKSPQWIGSRCDDHMNLAPQHIGDFLTANSPAELFDAFMVSMGGQHLLAAADRYSGLRDHALVSTLQSQKPVSYHTDNRGQLPLYRPNGTHELPPTAAAKGAYNRVRMARHDGTDYLKLTAPMPASLLTRTHHELPTRYGDSPVPVAQCSRWTSTDPDMQALLAAYQ